MSRGFALCIPIEANSLTDLNGHSCHFYDLSITFISHLLKITASKWMFINSDLEKWARIKKRDAKPAEKGPSTEVTHMGGGVTSDITRHHLPVTSNHAMLIYLHLVKVLTL